jgi:hypothetical protein
VWALVTEEALSVLRRWVMRAFGSTSHLCALSVHTRRTLGQNACSAHGVASRMET